MPTYVPKHKLQRQIRVPVAPAVLSGVLVTITALGPSPVAQAASTGSGGTESSPSAALPRESSAAILERSVAVSRGAERTPIHTASVGDAAQGYTFDPRTPQRVLVGFKLAAKPPPWQLPVAGYHLTGRFGMVSGLWAHTHTGLDFAAAQGTPIRAIGPGTVTSIGYDGAYGNKTVVRLDDGTDLWFCHQSATAASVGERVSPGELIGYVGSTGNVTGPHLHLEVRPGGGGPVDPESWLPRHGLHP